MADDELFELTRRLRASAALAPDKVQDMIKKAAQNIKNDWARLLRERSKHGHIPHLPRAVGYDVRKTTLGATAQVGPDKNKRQGPLGNLLEFGSINNPPGLEGAVALRAEAPKLFAEITKAEFLDLRGQT